MSNLQAFFAQSVQVEDQLEVVISKRFKDSDGKAIPWVLRSISEEENEELRKASTKRKPGKGGAMIAEVNSDEYLARMGVASVVFPDLKDPELQKSYGVLGAENVLRKMLRPGEYSSLLEKVQEINGFDKDINKLVDDVKN